MTDKRVLTRADFDPRTYAKPLQEMANAMSASPAWPAVFEAGSSRLLAVAALGALRRLGFINDIGLAAIKAEEAEDRHEQ